MKLINVDISKIMGPYDMDEARQYIGCEGYFTEYITNFDVLNLCTSGKLLEINCDEQNYKEERSGKNFQYFMPLSAICDKEYVPCEGERDFEQLFGCSEFELVGRKIKIAKVFEQISYCTMITQVKRTDVKEAKDFQITLGDGQSYSGETLFRNFRLCLDGEWRPFGVPREVREQRMK